MASPSIDAPIQSPSFADFATTSPFSIKNILNLPENPLTHSKDVAFEITRADMPLRPFTYHTSSVHRDVRPVPVYDSAIITSSPTPSRLGAYTFLSPIVTDQMKQYVWSGLPLALKQEIFRKKRPAKRPVFSPFQTKALEMEFAKWPYIAITKRTELATRLRLTETQVKTWFQNRRTKWKREKKEKLGPSMVERKFWVKANKQPAQQPK